MRSEIVRRWRARGAFERAAGHEVFVVDEGAGDPVVLLHGFPTSSSDWHAVWDRLGDRRRVALDLPGFGLSEKPADYAYGLMEQAEVVLAVLGARGLERAHLVGHDMGTSVACELLARRERGASPFAPRSLTLMNGSVHIEMARLTPSQRLLRSPVADAFARIGRYPVFRMQLRRILGRPVPEAELEAMWEQLVHLDGKRRLPAIIRYVDERWRFRHRWIGALTRLDVPALVAWGPRDPVAVFAIAEQLAREIPTARLERLDDLGHYPQLEDPPRVGGVLRAFFDAHA
ncbi:MAG TPA: alpha/beta fold hydrolase [Sandaracinaceae bacterium LLY-WYZ-13_1]|nr:alpha/beta fold hydrolase [Sandaracinaceae bacterium LLY-WYZ-13_1]